MTRFTLIIFCIIGTALANIVHAQDEAKKEGAKQAEFNSEGQTRDHAPEASLREGEESENASGNTGEQDNLDDESKSTYTATPPGTRTTSSSGSPGILVDENQPDGTNTMQRAQPNIAGAKVPGSVEQKQKRSDVPETKKIPANVQKKVPADAIKDDKQKSDAKPKAKKKK